MNRKQIEEKLRIIYSAGRELAEKTIQEVLSGLDETMLRSASIVESWKCAATDAEKLRANAVAELGSVQADLVEAHKQIRDLRDNPPIIKLDEQASRTSMHDQILRLGKDLALKNGIIADHSRTILGLRDQLQAQTRTTIECARRAETSERQHSELAHKYTQVATESAERGKKIDQLQKLINRQRRANNNLRDKARTIENRFARMVPKADHDSACRTIALMHEAATGRRGEAPRRGVVEDMEDVRTELLKMERIKNGALHDLGRIVQAIRRNRDAGVNMTAELFEIANSSGGEVAKQGIEDRLSLLDDRNALAHVMHAIDARHASFSRPDSPGAVLLADIKRSLRDFRMAQEKARARQASVYEVTAVGHWPTEEAPTQDAGSAMHDVLADNGRVMGNVKQPERFMQNPKVCDACGGSTIVPGQGEYVVERCKECINGLKPDNRSDSGWQTSTVWSAGDVAPCKGCKLEADDKVIRRVEPGLHTCAKHAAPAIPSESIGWAWHTRPDGVACFTVNGRVADTVHPGSAIANRVAELLNRHGMSDQAGVS